MDTKLCYKCKLTKPYDDFYKDINGKYGLSSKCKICSSETFKEYYKKNEAHHKNLCNQEVLCEECLGYYKKNCKTIHYKTLKHINKAKDIQLLACVDTQKIASIEELIKNCEKEIYI